MSKIEKALNKAKLKRWSSQENEQVTSVIRETPVRGEHEFVHIKTKTITLKKEHLEKKRLMTFLDNSRAVDFYNLLGAKLLKTINHNLPVTILVTSAIDGEGKTVTAINLSAIIAKATRKNVFLLDIDLRNPKTQDYLGCHFEKGLSDYLQGEEDLADLIINVADQNIFVLPAGKVFSGSSDVFNSSKMKKLFQEIRTRYPDSYLVCDSPPVLLGSDTVFISSHVDGVVLVVEAGKTPQGQILEALKALENRNIYGLIINKMDMSHRKYYYYHKYPSASLKS